eukprot:6529842-Lingulodinium_polyedra.AAC.1
MRVLVERLLIEVGELQGPGNSCESLCGAFGIAADGVHICSGRLWGKRPPTCWAGVEQAGRDAGFAAGRNWRRRRRAPEQCEGNVFPSSGR